MELKKRTNDSSNTDKRARSVNVAESLKVGETKIAIYWRWTRYTRAHTQRKSFIVTIDESLIHSMQN